MTEITDASDWPRTEMREFERKLRCPICQEFYRAAVMLRGCSHNFCSLCIRRALAVTCQCPVCRQAAATTELEVNRILDELVADFSLLRGDLLKMMNQRTNSFRECSTNSHSTPHSCPQPQSQPQPQPQPQSSSLPSSQSSQGKRKSPRLREETEPQSSSPKDVECPVCEGRIPLEKIKDHVELCLLRSTREPCQQPLAPAKSPKPMKRMNKPVYNLLKDNDIRKLLSELNLPTAGEREQMIRRHSEFLMLYNAECDSTKPKTMEQLRSELRAFEKAWKGKPPSIDLGKDDDFEQAAAQYRKRNADHFRHLIESVKSTKSPKNKQL